MTTSVELLHHPCGMHRGSPPSARGTIVSAFYERQRAHLDAGPCHIHEAAAPLGDVTATGGCAACGQLPRFHPGWRSPGTGNGKPFHEGMTSDAG